MIFDIKLFKFKRTKFEQEGIITVSGIGWFNSFAETCAATVLSSGAYKVNTNPLSSLPIYQEVHTKNLLLTCVVGIYHWL